MRRSWAVAGADVLAWWVVLTALYVVLISDVTPLELAVGGGGAIPAAYAAHALRGSGGTPGGRARAARALLAWPGTLLVDTARLTVLTLRGAVRPGTVKGRFRTVELGPDTHPGWASALLSAAPGTYVVDVRPRSGGGRDRGPTLLVHALPGPASAVERALTGGPPS